MKDGLVSVYNWTRGDGGEERSRYSDYCNTPISVEALGNYRIGVTRYDGQESQTEIFDVRNTSVDVYLDKVALWLVTGKKSDSSASSDPLDW